MSRIVDMLQKLKHAPSIETGKPNGNSTSNALPEPGRDIGGRVSPSYVRSTPARLSHTVLARNRCVAFFSELPEIESYRVLRAQVLPRMLRKGGNTLMVTSALPGEGKTLTAVNLSFTIAKEFKHTVLLVDCDLKQQNVHKVLGIHGERGIVDYLLDNRPLEDLIVWPRVDKMTLISGGKTAEESSELLGSPRMKDLVAEMKDRYPDRFVIFDVPPVLVAADTLAFAPLVDHVLVVVQAGKTPLPEIKKALEMLPKEKVLGIVLNRHEESTKPYYRQYYRKKQEDRS
jgi:non-specific protein-tyrosine kinase